MIRNESQRNNYDGHFTEFFHQAVTSLNRLKGTVFLKAALDKPLCNPIYDQSEAAGALKALSFLIQRGANAWMAAAGVKSVDHGFLFQRS